MHMPLTAEVPCTVSLLTHGTDRCLAFRVPVDAVFEAIGLPWCKLDTELAVLLDDPVLVRAARVQRHANKASGPRGLRMTVAHAAKFACFVILKNRM